MRKIFVIVIAFSLFFYVYHTLAEEIVILETPDINASDIVNMDDIKIGQTTTINGYGDITILDADWAERFGRRSGGAGIYTAEFTAPDDAIYFIIKIKILNTMMTSHNFRYDFGDVICAYGEGYKFGGFVEELSYANGGELTMAKGRGQATDVDPLYDKDYFVAVTLPKVVQTRTNEPLSISFSIGNNEFIYNVRKAK